MRQDLSTTYTIVWSLALANVIGAGLCIVLSKQIAKLTTIRFTLLAPYLFMIIAFAAFQSRQSIGDLIALVAIGFLGIFLRRFDYSRPAFLIGFVLSNQAESFANMANQIAGARFRRGFDVGLEYIASPLVLILLVLTIVSIIFGIRNAKNIRENIDAPTGTKRGPVIFLLVVTAYIAVSLWDASTITRFGDKIFPMVVGTVTLIGCLLLLLRMRLKPETDDVFIDLEAGGPDAEAPHGLWRTLAWFIGLLCLTGLFGLVIALAIFFVAFFRLRGGLGWAASATYAAAGVAFMLFLAWVLGREFPPGLLQAYTNLPWPLR